MRSDKEWSGGMFQSSHVFRVFFCAGRRFGVICLKKLLPAKKIDMAYFRGSRTSSERDNIVLLSRKHPEIIGEYFTVLCIKDCDFIIMYINTFVFVALLHTEYTHTSKFFY